MSRRSASIRFRQPGRGRVAATFRLSDAELREIREALEREDKIDRDFSVAVRDEAGMVVAEVQKVIQVRRKEGRAGRNPPPSSAV